MGALTAAFGVALLAAAPAAQVAEAAFPGADGASHLGWSVSISGDTAVAGGPGRHDNSLGRAHVYRRTGGIWSETQVLSGSTTVKLGWFGYSVSLDGDAFAAGDWGESDGAIGEAGFSRGSAFVFRRPDPAAPFVEEVRLQPLDLVEHDRFGTVVALDGDVLAVSAPGADDAGSESGAVYLFRHDGAWTEEARLVAPAGAADDRYGTSLALSGDTLVVGSDGADLAAADAGAAYVYVHDGSAWSLQATLTSPDAAQDDRFGTALALQGDALAVGVPHRDAPGARNAGAVEVWRRSGTLWSREATLQRSLAALLDNLGTSVAFDDDRVLAGAPHVDVAGPQAGAALLFRKQAGTWSLTTQILAPGVDRADQFGRGVALDGALAVVGAPRAWNGGVTNLGTVHLFGAVPGGTP